MAGDGGSAGDAGGSYNDTSTLAYMLPRGLAIVILVFSIFFAVMSLVVVSLRIWIRARGNILGWDDGLMGGGLLLFLASAGLASYATFEGLGVPVSDIDSEMRVVGQKVGFSPKSLKSWSCANMSIQYVMIWQLFYVLSLILIKNSICMTLLRIAVNKFHKWALYITMGLSTAIGLVGFIGMLSVCKPITGQWETGTGECAPRSTTISLHYLISAGAIVTDWSCAIIPALILWNAQMKRNVKMSVGIVLGLGSLASLSTFARLPYLRYYGDQNNFLCKLPYRKRQIIRTNGKVIDKVGNIVLWSVFEGGIGLIAGSLPMLRPLFKHWIGSTSRNTTAGPSHRHTIGGSHMKHSLYSQSQKPPPYSARGVRTREDREWARLDDSSSDSPQLHGVLEHSESQYELADMGRRDADIIIKNLEKQMAHAR